MGKDSPAPPPTPDPYATASAQGTANAGTATAQTALNNANVYNPYGSTTFAVTGEQSIRNPDGSYTSVPTYTENQKLSPAQQNLLNQQNQLSSQTNKAAEGALSSIGSTLAQPITSDQLSPLQLSAGATPTLANSYASGQLQTGYDQGGAIQTSVPMQQADTTFGQTQNGVQYFQPGDFNAARDSATNAALARLQPQMDQQNAALKSQLANQGIMAGSSAYNDALLQNAQGINDQRLGAVQTGDAEQQALFGQAAQANQLFNAAQAQDYSQQQGRGQFQQAGTAANNTSALAAGTFADTAQAQQNAENAAAAGFGNAAVGQQAQMAASQAAFGNTAASQDYQNRLAGGAFQNSAAAQQLQQQMALQNQQINEISALRSGGQVSQLNSPNYSAGTLDQTPISSDVYASAGLQNQQYLAQLQQQAANTSAMGSVLGGFTGGLGKSMGSKSDRRLKSDIERVATARNGLTIYSYRLQGASGWHLGFMADEVALLHPEAVWTDPDDGWARVDYERAVA